MDGAIDPIQRYCRQTKIEYSKIKGLLGAIAGDKAVDKRNWVTMEKTIDTFNKMRISLNKNSTKLRAEQWTNFGQSDCLYFLDFKFHCFFLLYIDDLQISQMEEMFFAKIKKLLQRSKGSLVID